MSSCNQSLTPFFATISMATGTAGMSMQEVADRVMAEFHDPNFQAEVETFINCHIEEFAVVHFDGSCPMQWVNIHRKFRKLYEDLVPQQAFEICALSGQSKLINNSPPARLPGLI